MPLPSVRKALYKGDGKFTDRGLAIACERYEIDFGALPLQKRRAICFQLRPVAKRHVDTRFAYLLGQPYWLGNKKAGDLRIGRRVSC